MTVASELIGTRHILWGKDGKHKVRYLKLMYVLEAWHEALDESQDKRQIRRD